MNCCVQAPTENLKHLGQKTLFLQLVTQVVPRAVLQACVGVTLAQPAEEKKATTWNKSRKQNGKNIFHLLCIRHALLTCNRYSICAKQLCRALPSQKKKYSQKIELSYQTVTLTSTDHLKFKATFVDNTVPHAYTILSDFPLPS